MKNLRRMIVWLATECYARNRDPSPHSPSWSHTLVPRRVEGDRWLSWMVMAATCAVWDSTCFSRWLLLHYKAGQRCYKQYSTQDIIVGWVEWWWEPRVGEEATRSRVSLMPASTLQTAFRLQPTIAGQSYNKQHSTLFSIVPCWSSWCLPL